MKFAKKYFLVDEHKLADMKESTSITTPRLAADLAHPNVQAVAEEKSEIRDILEDKGLTDYEKVERHSQSIVKYLSNLKDALRVSRKQAILGEDPPSSPTGPMRGDKDTGIGKEISDERKNGPRVSRKLPMTQITNALPWGHRHKGRILLRGLNKAPGFTWDREGTVSYKGNVFKDTNITELTHQYLTDSNPEGRANKLVATLLRDQSIGEAGSNKRQQQKGNGIGRLRTSLRGRWLKQ